MHDINSIRTNPVAFDAALVRRGLPPSSAEILKVDEDRRRTIFNIEALLAEKNHIAQQIGFAKRNKEDTTEFENRGSVLREEISAMEPIAKSLDEKQKELLSVLPNILDENVPDGLAEHFNKYVSDGLVSVKKFNFEAREHHELGAASGLMDFETATKMAGPRFSILQGDLARLERALGQFMLDTHTGKRHGYKEVSVPLLVNDLSMYGTGQLPKFENDLFKTTDGRWLIPTAEVPLTNIVANSFVAGMPLRFVALTPCFRSEAGSAGKDVRGILRQHQFNKVELVSIVEPSMSEIEHERMTECAEDILERLDLPYRRMLLCAGDTGFSAAKTYDLEVWLPGQKTYREISSCSNMKDFQSRRMNAKYKMADGKKEFVHTLNGSGVAVGRALIAVLENYQQKDGSVVVPSVLRPYMGGIKILFGKIE